MWELAMNKITFPLFHSIKVTALSQVLLVGLLFTHSAQALPDDENQPVFIDANDGHLLRDGISTLYGSPDEPVVVTQGSMKMTALEVTIEMIDGEIHTANATGGPAEFQHQPEIDQAIVYARGQNMDFDITAQFLNVDGEAEFIRDLESTKAAHIDYNLKTEIVNANSATDSSEQVRIILMPKTE